MARIIGMIITNPALLVWIALAIFVGGFGVGWASAYYFQGIRIKALKLDLTIEKNKYETLQTKYDKFVSDTKTIGEAAKKRAAQIDATNKKRKEVSDHAYETTIAKLHADVKRLRDSRARSNYVPSAPTGSSHPNFACFDRADLERAIQQFDTGVSRIVEKGDEATIGINVGRAWASQLLP